LRLAGRRAKRERCAENDRNDEHAVTSGLTASACAAIGCLTKRRLL
jgi:hypothetical protein